MKIAKVLAGLGVLAMTSVLIYGFAVGNFSADGGKIIQNPWGIVSLVDLYTGFFLFSAWIVFREGINLRSIVWVILMMVLGFFAASLYALIALYQSGGDWHKFWMGKRVNEQN